jgi:hypothetical protein
MRKHLAKNVPDVVARSFKQDDHLQDNVVAFHEWFKGKMQIKHGTGSGITEGVMHIDHVEQVVWVTMHWHAMPGFSLQTLAAVEARQERILRGYDTPNVMRRHFGLTERG